MGVPIVIDNKPGGSYTIGTMDLVHSAPDGYTLAYGNVVSLATNRSLIASMPYDVDRDLTLISAFFPVFLFIFCVPFATLGAPVTTITFYMRISVAKIVAVIGSNLMGMNIVREGTGLYNSTQHYGYDVAADLQPGCRYDDVVRALGGAGGPS